MEGPQFLHLLWVFCQDLELQVALTGRKKPVLGQKKATNNFFDADLNHIKLNSKILTNNQIYQREVYSLLKFIYSETATKLCKFSTLIFTVCTAVKSKVEIVQNFVAFSEHMNFKIVSI